MGQLSSKEELASSKHVSACLPRGYTHNQRGYTCPEGDAPAFKEGSRPLPKKRTPPQSGTLVKPRTDGHLPVKLSVSAKFFRSCVRQCELFHAVEVSLSHRNFKTPGHAILLRDDSQALLPWSRKSSRSRTFFRFHVRQCEVLRAQGDAAADTSPGVRNRRRELYEQGEERAQQVSIEFEIA